MLLLVLLAFIVTTAFENKAEIVIDRPRPEVFDYLRSIKNQRNWSVWGKDDPNMKEEFIGTDGTVGFIERWEGNNKVGKGSQEITRIVEGERMECLFHFEKPMRMTNDVYIATTTVEGNKTKVVWCISGKAPRPFNLVFPLMKGSMMKGFRKGLSNLKGVLEG